jgi:radical SAM superfamily enzyme YgiQ (UPF0313 family)
MITLVHCVAPHTTDEPGIPPPGLLSLAASIRRAGFAVRFADLACAGNAGLPAPEDFPKWLGEPTPMVGFSTMSNQLPYALEAARCLKQASPKTTILFGGCGPQAAVREILEQFPFIDFVFQGEAEHTFPEFLRRQDDRDAWSQIKGLAYRKNGSVQVNPPPLRIKDLDALPRPAYDLVDLSDYAGHAGLQTSRGCPFSCTYCEGSLSRKQLVAMHSIGRVIEDIRHLQTLYPAIKLGLVDDTFTVRRERAARFCREYLAAGFNFYWGLLTRVDGIDVPMMQLLSKARCRNLYFGIESGSNKTLRAIRKGITRGQICDILPQACDYFPEVTASFMWGFPFEELADLEETLLLAAFLRSYGIKIQLHLWSPMPRSLLFKQYQDQLVYDPKVQSNVVLGNVTRFQSLIASNPAIFAPFYHVPHPAFAQKRQMLEGMGFTG